VLAVLALVLVLLLAWPIGLLIWANGQITHVDALSDAPGTPGVVYLLAGSDSRADGGVAQDGTLGQRTDTIMLLTSPRTGTPSLISLPRDTLVEIPGIGEGKLNSAYSQGGAPLLVETVENLSGMKVDHYVEVGMGGVKDLVDAVGGVELCMDRDVNDEFSGLVWAAGCHEADGTTALAFARMRYADPTGDIGRTERQQQLISAVTREAATPSSVLNPFRQVSLIRAGTGALAVSNRTGIIDLARLAMTFRAATGPEGLRGTPPIADPDHRTGIGSTVLLEDDVASFFAKVADGSIEPTEATTPSE
jgi:LCP family protein required for cell wall assembly